MNEISHTLLTSTVVLICKKYLILLFICSLTYFNTPQPTPTGPQEFNFFTDWQPQNGHPIDFELLRPEFICVLLQEFYADMKNQDGKEYSRSALLGIRAAIQRHLVLPPSM